jgi:hypothetical protein
MKQGITDKKFNLFLLTALTIAGHMLAELLGGTPDEILEAIQAQANQVIKDMEDEKREEILETLPNLIKISEQTED